MYKGIETTGAAASGHMRMTMPQQARPVKAERSGRVRRRGRLAARLGLAAACLLIAACQRDAADGPLAIEGKVFIFNYRVATATYVLTLARRGPLPDDSRIEVSYEDPRGGPALVTQSRIYPFWQKIPLESPPVHCIVKDRPYKIAITVSDGAGKQLQRIDTTLASTMDQSILPAKPLVVGAIYTANPEVYKPGQPADFAPEDGCPAR